MNYTKLNMDEKEYNDYVENKAAKSTIFKNCIFAFIVGGFICIILALVSKNVFKCPEVAFAALLVFFAMRGSQDIAYCVKLKERKRLVQGILELTMAVAFAVGLVILLIK